MVKYVVIYIKIKNMQAAIIQIGNSKGIVLPIDILKRYQLHDTVELVLEDNHLLIKPTITPRKNWEKAFAEMRTNGDDKLLIDSVL